VPYAVIFAKGAPAGMPKAALVRWRKPKAPPKDFSGQVVTMSYLQTDLGEKSWVTPSAYLRQR